MCSQEMAVRPGSPVARMAVAGARVNAPEGPISVAVPTLYNAVKTAPRRRAMSVVMPEPDTAVLARRAEIVRALSAIVPGEGVIASEREMRPYESDGLTAYRQLPMIVV